MTDFRENTLQDVITKIEPELFQTVTSAVSLKANHPSHPRLPRPHGAEILKPWSRWAGAEAGGEI